MNRDHRGDASHRPKSVAGDTSTRHPAAIRTKLRSVSLVQSPSISPDHPDVQLLALGHRFDSAVLMMRTAEKRSNALCIRAEQLGCDLAGISYPAPLRQAHLWIKRLREAEDRIGGIEDASRSTNHMTAHVGYLADEIARHPPTTMEGLRVHVKVLREMYPGGVATIALDDPDKEYARQIVRQFTDVLLK